MKLHAYLVLGPLFTDNDLPKKIPPVIELGEYENLTHRQEIRLNGMGLIFTR